MIYDYFLFKLKFHANKIKIKNNKLRNVYERRVEKVPEKGVYFG